MRTSGRGHEGWMTWVPLGVAVFFFTYMAGGPMEVVDIVNDTTAWLVEAVLKTLG